MNSFEKSRRSGRRGQSWQGPVAPAEIFRSYPLGSAARRLVAATAAGPEQPKSCLPISGRRLTMRTHRLLAIESLETKRCLTISATVSAGGDLRVEGAAD